MLNSTVLEVAAGLIFTFLAISLATSALVEAIASGLKWRSRTLLAGVKALVNDSNFSGLAKGLYEHALVNPRGPGGSEPKTNMPAYIDSQRFAEALLDVVGLTNALRPPPAAAGTNMAAAHTVVDTNVPQGANAQINNLLHGAILRALGDFAAVKQEIASWFDTGMDRVSGAYKRWSQLVGFCIALILCVSLNIDTAHIARTLWVNPGIAATLKATQDAKSGVTELVTLFQSAGPRLLPGRERGAVGSRRQGERSRARGGQRQIRRGDHRLAHHRARHAVRRALLVRRAAECDSPRRAPGRAQRRRSRARPPPLERNRDALRCFLP